MATHLASRNFITLIVLAFALPLHVGIAIWLGDILGNIFYGFLIVTACIAFVAAAFLIIYWFTKKRKRKPVDQR